MSYLHLKRELNPAFKKEQAKKIVELIEKGLGSSTLSKLLGISRERIGQVYFREKGSSIPQFRMTKKLEAVDTYLEAMKKVCVRCGKEFMTTLRNKKYCSIACYLSKHKEQRHLLYLKFMKMVRKERKEKNESTNNQKGR